MRTRGAGRKVTSLVCAAVLLWSLLPAQLGAVPISRLDRMLGDLGLEARPDSVKVLIASEAEGPNGNTKLIGASLFTSGLFLCSWGIVSWQLKEDQCCPPRNTENALKIIVGIVLIDAGLVYLRGGLD